MRPDIVYRVGAHRTSGWFRHEIEAVILRWLILFRNVHHPTGISAYYLCCRARSFVLLSDVYVAMDKKLDARQYLLSLQQNYHADDDIEQMINERLEKLK